MSTFAQILFSMHKKAILILLILLANVAMSFAGNGYTLVIDAGHGGHDTGAKGANSFEKDINLKVALAFGNYVEQNCKDVNVIYTRKTDVFIPLKTRANIANKNNADLFVSVHTNALPNGRIARGFEVYTLGMHRAKDNLDVAMRENSVIEEEDNYKQTYQGFDPKSSESYIMFEFMQSANMRRSVELAKMIEESACETAGRNNMGVHQAGFLVLRETSMPSCLIELGFITTPDEEDYLNTDEGVDKLAFGIYKAFVKFKNKYSGNGNNKNVVKPGPKDTVKVDNVDNDTTIPAKKTDVKIPDNPPVKAPVSKKPAPVKKQDIAVKTENTKTVKQPTVKNTTSKQKEKKTEPVKNETAPKQPKKVVTAEKKEQTKKVEKPANKAEKTAKKEDNSVKKVVKSEAKANENLPIFKVQVFAVSRELPANDPLLKGHKDYTTYKQAGSSLTKYTIGSSTDYNAIVNLRNTLRSDFPQAYIVAFKNGKPVNLTEAINEYKKHNRKHSNK